MKKLFYSLSVALACGLVANAAPNAQIAKINTESLSNAELVQAVTPSSIQFMPVAKKNVKGAKKRVATKEDYMGEYNWAGTNCLTGVVFPNEGTMNIQQDPDHPDSLLITGFDYLGDLRGHVDAATGRLYIPNQFSYVNTYYNQECWFMNYTLINGVDEEDGSPAYFYELNEISDFFFTLDVESGYIAAGDMDMWDQTKFNNHQYTDAELRDVICIASNLMPADQSGYFWLCRFVEGSRLSPYELNLDEWLTLGATSFKDPYFPNLFEDNDTPVYDVTLYRNKLDMNTFMVYQPYGPDSFYGDADFMDGKGGAIIFNIEDPDCVVLQPLVYTVSFDFGDEDGEDWIKLYMYNQEGYSYYLGATEKVDIFTYYLKNGMDCSAFYPNPAQSAYPGLTKPVVEIYHGCFGQTGAIASTYVWVYMTDDGEQEAYDLDGYVEMTDNYDDPDVYVQAIGAESNDAPVYYNLQGVRVNNPEQGHLLIVKKGNVTTKQIVR